MIKQRIVAGELGVMDALSEPACQSMRVGDLLAAQHRWGAGRARRVLDEVHMSGTYTVGQVTERQARLLRRAIGRRESVTAARRREAIAVA